MLKNRVSIICKEGEFQAGILLEQIADFHSCYRCTGDGRWTYLVKVKKIVDFSTKKEVGTRTRLGIAIKKALLEKFHGRYLCEECATKKWNIFLLHERSLS